MSSIFGKSVLLPEWVERFREVAKLNSYAKVNSVRLNDVVIDGYDLSGVQLSGAKFENTEWKNVTFKSGEFTKTQFLHSNFEEVVFENVLFKDTVFEGVTFDASTFFNAEFQNVRFVRCQFKNTGLDSLKASTIIIDDSTLEDVSFYRSAVIATVRGSKLKDVNMRSLISPSSLTFEKSELKEIKFSRSRLDSFSLLQVTGEKCGFEGGHVAKVEIVDSAIGFGMSEVEIGKARIHASKIRSRFSNSKIGEMKVSDCREVTDFGFYGSIIGSLEIERCNLTNFRLPNAVIENLRITDSALSENDFEELKAKVVTLEKVILSGKVDFSKAHVEQIVTKDITKLPGLNLITTGSNVKIEEK